MKGRNPNTSSTSYLVTIFGVTVYCMVFPISFCKNNNGGKGNFKLGNFVGGLYEEDVAMFCAMQELTLIMTSFFGLTFLVAGVYVLCIALI